MSESVAVLIPSFGPHVAHWTALTARALRSVTAQTRAPEQTFSYHYWPPRVDAHFDGLALGPLRNWMAAQVTADWLLFLDADDELEPRYIEAMLDAHGDVRYPLVRILTGTPDEAVRLPDPIEIAKRNLLIGNYIVIGAMIRRQMFLDLGGFDDYPIVEDWPLWIKAWLSGADIQLCSEAIYRQHWREGSRNQMKESDYLPIYESIRSRFMPEAMRKGLA